MTIPLSAATRRNPLIINSRAMMMMTNHACNFPNGIIQIIAEHTSSLSAKGSMNFPKFVTRFLARAILPSSISVRLATQNKTNAIHLFAGPPTSVNIKNTKNGTMITRNTVSLFGKFIISALLSNHIPVHLSRGLLQNLHSSILRLY